MLSLDRLRAFAVFSEHLNFTRAARALHISQPALHAQVAKLAEELDAELYRRDGRALALTEEGVHVARFARGLMERVGEFHDEMRLGKSLAPAVLSAGEGAYLYLLGDAIRAYLAEPDARLRLVSAGRQTSVEHVRHGIAHLAVAAMEVPPDDLEAEILAEVPQVLVLPCDHALARRERACLTELEGARLVVPPRDREHRRVLESALGRAGVTWEVAVEAAGWELMLHFVGLGLGWAVVNGCARIPEGFRAVLLPELPTQRYHALYRAPLGHRARSLLQALRRHVR